MKIQSYSHLTGLEQLVGTLEGFIIVEFAWEQSSCMQVQTSANGNLMPQEMFLYIFKPILQHDVTDPTDYMTCCVLRDLLAANNWLRPSSSLKRILFVQYFSSVKKWLVLHSCCWNIMICSKKHKCFRSLSYFLIWTNWIDLKITNIFNTDFLIKRVCCNCSSCSSQFCCVWLRWQDLQVL